MRYALLVLASLLFTTTSAAASVISPAEWQSYRDHFITEEGRVVDTANNDISHSEGQGYGLLLSVLADDRATFESIWSFTRTELLVRDDGLAAWRWDPAKSPHVSDINNATDGDILIAYALGLAGETWQETDKWQAAQAIAEAVGSKTLAKVNGLMVILPASKGFSKDDRGDGPVVNPSYWVFEAFPELVKLAPDFDWTRLAGDGEKLLARARFGPANLPSDWISLKADTPRPAAGMPAEFGYNNIRIPLYLLRSGADADALRPFAAIGTSDGLMRIDIASGNPVEQLTEPGYRLIGAAIACKLEGKPITADLQTFAPTTYFAATLQLLLLDYLRRNAETCLGGQQ